MTAAVLRAIAALGSGAVFGLGLAMSGMMNPVRVRGFLDLFGVWDPTLAFVMGGAVMAAFAGVAVARRMQRPVLDRSFSMPTSRLIDGRLVFGSTLFGIGWGMAGLCPGPALAGLSLGLFPVAAFVIAMIIGMLLHDRFLAAGLASS